MAVLWVGVCHPVPIACSHYEFRYTLAWLVRNRAGPISPISFFENILSEKATMNTETGSPRIIRFDEHPVPGAQLDDLPPALWQRFASARVADSREVLLGKLAGNADQL